MTCGIYMIQNKVNNKIYIGQAVDIEKRWKDHKRGLRGNYHYNEHLQRAWNEYEEDNFEFTIICECDENQLNTMEEYYIFELMSYDYRVGYNKNYGGGSGRPTEEARKKISENHARYWKGKTQSEETKKKMSESHKGENHHFYGKQHSEESRKKISESVKIAMSSPEVRKKISESLKGENHPNYGKPRSEETKKKIGEANRGENNYWYGKFGFKNPSSIPVAQLTLTGELVEVYGSAHEAKRSGFDYRLINGCCRGKRKKHGGYKWMYLSDYEAMKKEG